MAGNNARAVHDEHASRRDQERVGTFGGGSTGRGRNVVGCANAPNLKLHA